MSEEKLGHLYPSSKEKNGKRIFFFRDEVGDCKVGEIRLELTTNHADKAPIVYCENTGRWFVLAWKDIVSIALARGIADLSKPFDMEQGCSSIISEEGK